MHSQLKKVTLAVAPAVVALLLLGGTPAFAKSAHDATGAHHNSTHQIKAKKVRPSQDARSAFAAKKWPAALPSSSIGTYAEGCVAGTDKLAKDGPHWQVMRLSRNRYWGRQAMIDYIKSLSERAHKDGWNGVLVGDMGMPRGGPMPTGHASHQIGLDVDLWLRPAPSNTLSDQEREELSAYSVLQIDSADLDMSVWTPEHAAFVKDAAQDPNVTRIFVTPAIKKYLCDRKDKSGADTEWLRRLRPCHSGVCEGHDDHIHVRLNCVAGDKSCQAQPPPDAGDGCGSEVTDALHEVGQDPPYTSQPQPNSNNTSPFPLSKLPKACIGVLNAPDKVTP